MPVNIIIDSKFDDRGVKNAQQQLQRMAGDAAKRVAQVGAAVAAAGAVAAGKLAVDAVKAASDFEESVNAVNVAFGEAAQGVLDIGENAAKSMGLSQNEFNQAATRFSAFAETVVGEGGDVAGFIGDVSQRAADFASVFNIDVSEALQVFQSGLAGEAEPLKRFGINLLQSEVAAFAMANGIAESAAEMTEAQKVQARYGLLLESTAKTQGDFQNTSDSLANSQRILRAELENLQIEIGSALIPVAKELVNTFGDALIPRLEDFGRWINSPEGIASVTEFGEGLVDVFEAALDFGGWIADNLDVLKNLGIVIATVTAGVYAYRAATLVATVAQAGLNAAMLLNPIGALVGLFAAVTTAVTLFTIGNQNATPTQESLNDEIVETRKQLEFYRGEMAKTQNTKLYESTISDLEEQLRKLRIEQQELNGHTNQFSQLADNAKFSNLRRELGLTTGSTNELEEATVKLSIAQQARMIHEDELARAMRAGAMGVENAGQYVRSISDIMDALYAQNRAARQVGEYLPSLTQQVNTSTTSFSSQSSAIESATSATDLLTTSIEELDGAMADGVDASQDFLDLMNGIESSTPQLTLSEATRELHDFILEAAKADELIRQEGGLFEFLQGDSTVTAQFDEFGNLISAVTQAPPLMAGITGGQTADVNVISDVLNSEFGDNLLDMVGGNASAISDALLDQITLTNPTTGMQTVIGGGNEQALQDALDAGYVTNGQFEGDINDLISAIDQVAEEIGQDFVALATGGIVTQPTKALIGEAGPEAVIPLNKLGAMTSGGGNTFVINVTANTRAGGAAAGEEIVKALKAYQRQNGPIARELTGFGA